MIYTANFNWFERIQFDALIKVREHAFQFRGLKHKGLTFERDVTQYTPLSTNYDDTTIAKEYSILKSLGVGYHDNIISSDEQLINMTLFKYQTLVATN